MKGEGGPGRAFIQGWEGVGEVVESQGSSTENESTRDFGKIPRGVEESVMIPLLIHV